jgi:hypothetical protein
MIAGVQNNSANQTVDEAVRVTATPAAVIPNMAILTPDQMCSNRGGNEGARSMVVVINQIQLT